MRIAIIGAGMAGLAAAHDLQKAGHEVTIYEAAGELGGLAAGFKDPAWDWTLEKFYHHWFSSDDDVIDFLTELGFGDKLRFSSPTTSFYDPEGNFALDKPVLPSGFLSRIVNVLSIPGIGLIPKLRFGAVGVLLALVPDGTFLEKHTADRWMTRAVGAQAHNRIWRPMLIGKFGPMYDRVNMAWLWARIKKRTASLGTYEGGFQAALEDVGQSLRDRDVAIHLNMPVTGIHSAEDGGLTIVIPGDKAHYDRVIATVGPGLLARLAPGLPADYRDQLTSLKSMAALSVVATLDRQLMTEGTYWLNLPADTPDKETNPFPFLALVEHTNWQSPAHYNGDHVIYMGDYMAADHPYMSLSDDNLLDLYLPALKKANSLFDRSWLKRTWVFRVPYAQPVPLVDHSKHIPAIKTPMDGLYLVSMSQVYPWDRGTNYAVEMGRRVAGMIEG